MRTIAILPVKSFSHAKQRLRHEVSPALREALAEAMLCDVLAGLARCERLDGILVVSPSPRARELAESRGARTLADAEEGHNQAAKLGISAAAADGADRVLLVPGDCPAVDPAEIDDLLARRYPRPSVVIVPDRHGTGTNALLIAPPGSLPPSFGPGSCARHQADARRLDVLSELVEVPSLAIDVDTPEDLESLSSLTQLAPRTLELLSRC
jgi:2-phospho-L-lactate guanylyltransferase